MWKEAWWCARARTNPDRPCPAVRSHPLAPRTAGPRPSPPCAGPAKNLPPASSLALRMANPAQGRSAQAPAPFPPIARAFPRRAGAGPRPSLPCAGPAKNLLPASRPFPRPAGIERPLPGKNGVGGERHMRVRQVLTLLLLLTMLLGLGFFILGGIRTFLDEISRVLGRFSAY